MDVSDMRTNYNGRSNLFLEENLEIKEPFYLFDKWFKIVKNDPRTVEANAMCLATATKKLVRQARRTFLLNCGGALSSCNHISIRNMLDHLWEHILHIIQEDCSIHKKDGIPSARFVLLKGYSKEGFIFFTHYTSRKGQELEENPNAALTFYWEHYSRSVRVEGIIEKLPFSEADNYFSKRPYQSQIGALCSNQSKPIASRDILAAEERRLKSKYTEGHVPRPPLWGGYIVKPHTIEFWQGQTDRIHDRIRFRKPKETEPDGILTHEAEDGWVYERLCP